MTKYLLVLFLILVGCNGDGGFTPPSRCDAIVTWQASVGRIDGTLFTEDEIKKYTIYMSNMPNTDTIYIRLVIDVTNFDKNTYTFEELLYPGTNWFYMTVTDTEDRISGFSNFMGKNC